MFFEKCTENCGWIAAIVASIGFGSFGVPIKKVSHINVDPLVMQTSMTFVCFITSWIVIPFGEKFEFSPMGILSGLFWIPSSIGGIYAIQNAGLALSVGTWCSLNVLCSFFWGIFMFDEKVKNFRETLVSLTILIAGLVGMSVYASPAPRKQDQRHKLLHRHTTTSSSRGTTTSTPELSFEENDTAMITRSNVDDHDDERVTVDSLKSVSSKVLMSADTKVGPLSNRASTSIVRTRKKVADNKKGFSSLATTAVDRNITQYWDVECTRLVKKGYPPAQKKDIILRFLGGRVCLSTRQLGIMGAIFNGTWGSCKYIPMHYTGRKSFDGAGFLLSYACGSMLVAIVSWALRYLYNVSYFQEGKYQKAWAAMPAFHFNELFIPGLAAGVLWSFANLCSILAVSALGQGLGYTLVQSSMLVSGWWGILYGEIRGSERIYKWFISSVITILGIFMVSYEHQ